MPFSRSSRDIHLERNTVLVAWCRRIDGSESQSHLDLNQNIGNKQGVFDVGGKNFNGSARKVRLEGNSLCADLKSSNGHWYRDSINLDALVENRDGNLVIRKDVDKKAIRPPEWKPWANPAAPPREKDKNAQPPASQCHLCEDWPYTHVWKRSPSRPIIKAADLESKKRKKDCPTCALAERVMHELVPKLAHPRKAKRESIVLDLDPQPQDFPRFKIKFETEDGKKREVKCMMHSNKGEWKLFYRLRRS